jgi:flagellar export protein FliJ
MAFHFTLDAVLRYRRSREEQEQLRLQALLAGRARVLEELHQASDAQRHLRSTIQDALHRAAIPAVELQFAAAQLKGIAGRQERLQSRLATMETQIAEQTSCYRRERQNHEVLERVREQQFHRYRIVQLRVQQVLLDELYLLGRARERA